MVTGLYQHKLCLQLHLAGEQSNDSPLAEILIPITTQSTVITQVHAIKASKSKSEKILSGFQWQATTPNVTTLRCVEDSTGNGRSCAGSTSS